jgi:hypothetical protein
LLNFIVTYYYLIISIAILPCFPVILAEDNSTLPCSHFKDCSGCTNNWKCNWCESTLNCIEGGFFGNDVNCEDWLFRQCSIHGTYLIVAVVVVLFLMAVGFCAFGCYVLHKRNKRNGRRLVESLNIEEDEDEEFDSLLSSSSSSVGKQSSTEKKRRELYSKYGLQ